MKQNEDLEHISSEVKRVDEGIQSMIVPLLKDTIRDCNNHNKKLFICNMVQTVIILIIAIVALFFVYRQNVEYQEFLSQFEFESTETIYQDLDSGEGDIVNTHLETNKQR